MADLPSRASLRTALSGDLYVPRTRRRFGDRAFAFAAPRVRNSRPIPTDIKLHRSTTTSFKRRLKTVLFNRVARAVDQDSSGWQAFCWCRSLDAASFALDVCWRRIRLIEAVEHSYILSVLYTPCFIKKRNRLYVVFVWSDTWLICRVLVMLLIGYFKNMLHVKYSLQMMTSISQLTNLCKTLTPPISGIHRIYMWVRSVSICYRPWNSRKIRCSFSYSPWKMLK